MTAAVSDGTAARLVYPELVIERLRGTSFWAFDLDDTLYHPRLGVLDQIHERTRQFLRSHLGMSEADADRIRSSYLQKYGTTLAGLMQESGLQPDAFLEFVHDIDLSALDPDEELIAALARLSGRKVVFTNGPAIHASRILSRLGLDAAFDSVFDIAAAGYQPKPAAIAFERFRLAHAFDADQSAMFDDQMRNLAYPHQIGMTCVLVGAAPVEPVNHVHVAVEHLRPLLQALF